MSSVKRNAAGKIIEYGNFQFKLDELTPAEVREIQAQEIERDIAEQTAPQFFYFSWKNPNGIWIDPQPCSSAQEGRDRAYVLRGYRRGGWATCDADGLDALKKFIRKENAKTGK